MAGTGSTLQQCARACAESHYGDALWIAATSLGSVIAQDKGVFIDLGGPPGAQTDPCSLCMTGYSDLLIFGGLFLLLMIMGRGGRRGGGGGGGFISGLILGQMLGGRSCYGGRYSGSIRRVRLGDSFGGFGGGNSGGGGASSNW